MAKEQIGKEVLIQFVDDKNEPIGPHTIVPLKIDKQDLDDLINSFKGVSDNIERRDVSSMENYSYLVNDELPVRTTLWDTLKSRKLGTEDVVVIRCIPVSNYKMKPINTCCATLPGHQNSILCIACSPNSLRLATGAGDNMVRLWDTLTKTPVKTISFHTNWILSVLFSPDNKYIASASMAGDVAIHDAETGALVKSLKSHHKSEVTSLCFEPLNLLKNEDIKKNTNRKILNFENKQKDHVATAVKVEDLNDIHLENYNTMHIAKKLTMKEDDDKSKLPKIMRWVGHTEVNTSEDIKKTTETNSCSQKNAKLKEEKATAGAEEEAGAEASPKQQNWQQNSQQNSRTEKDKVSSENISYQQSRTTDVYLKSRLASAGHDAIIKIYDLFGQRPDIILTGHTGPITRIIWSGKDIKNSYIYSSSRDKTIKVWSVYREVLIYDFKHHNHWINWISLNTEQLIKNGVYDLDFIINKMDVKNAVERASRTYENFLISEKCEKIASCSEDGIIYLIHHLKNTFTYMKLSGHRKSVIHVNFSPDGKLIASASFDKTIRIWSAYNGHCLTVFRGHVGSVYRIAWCIDNNLLASCSEDSTVKVWDVSPYRNTKQNMEKCLLNNIERSKDVVDEFISDESTNDENIKQRNRKRHKTNEKSDKKTDKKTDEKTNEKADKKTNVKKTAKTIVKKIAKKNAKVDEEVNKDVNEKKSAKTTTKTIEKKSANKIEKAFEKTNEKEDKKVDDKKNEKTDVKTNAKTGTETGVTNIHAKDTNKKENSTIKKEKPKKTLLVDLPGHEAAVYAIDWSNDGKYVASGGKDKILRIWSH